MEKSVIIEYWCYRIHEVLENRVHYPPQCTFKEALQSHDIPQSQTSSKHMLKVALLKHILMIISNLTLAKTKHSNKVSSGVKHHFRIIIDFNLTAHFLITLQLYAPPKSTPMCQKHPSQGTCDVYHRACWCAFRKKHVTRVCVRILLIVKYV